MQILWGNTLFSGKIYTTGKILHDRWSRRSWQISSLGIGLVWDNHLIPYNISVWIMKFCSNYLWLVFRCSQNDVRCFQLFHRCFQMFLDVFGVLRMLSRCVQMITNVGRWIFSRSSLGVLLMFSGCSQDFSRMFWRVLWAWWVWGVWSLSL